MSCQVKHLTFYKKEQNLALSKVTLKDVAKDARVSVATVSHVVNGTKHVSEDTAEKVRQSIARLGYRMNRMAHNLKIGKSHTIGFIVAEMSNPFFMEAAIGIENVLKRNNYNLILANSDEKLKSEKEQIDNLMNQSIDGIVLAPTTNNHQYLEDIIPPDFPLVFIDRKPAGIKRDCILSTNIEGSYSAVDYLIGLGHRKIGLISGLVGLTTSYEREAGYFKALEDAGIKPRSDYIRNGDGRRNSGYLLMQELHNSTDITALFITNNFMALGALHYLNDNLVSMPEELSIVIFDDYDWADLYRPPLTVVKQNPFKIGEKAAEILLKQVDDHESGIEGTNMDVYRIETELIIRNSCSRI